MKALTTISCVLATLSGLFAQNADCDKIILMDDLNVRIDHVSGYGDKLEFNGNPISSEKYITEEHNTVWMSFKAPYDGQLTFELIPDSPEDDWDFMLFRANPSQCQEIINKTIEPVRSNLARNDAATKGRTGLSLEAKAPFSPAGVNPNFSKWLEVNEGWDFILVVDLNKISDNGIGYKMSIKSWDKEEVHIETPAKIESSGFVDMTDEVTSTDMNTVKFRLFEEGTEKPILCNAEIIGQDWIDSSISIQSKSEFEVQFPKNEWFYLNVKKEGYTFSSVKYKATDELAGGIQKVYLSKIKTGNHIVLNDIVFRENTSQMLPTSLHSLNQLINFMKEYPTATIEIQGHVNAPGYENDGKVKKISEKRAEQIKLYLVDAGIQGTRIKVKGMGNEFMIYPNPMTYEQEKANRRVEIEILSL